MADRPDPYVRKDPNDIIRSGDWNELQIKACEHILRHTHTGKHDEGSLLPGAAIDRVADINIRTLTTSGNVTVNGDLKVNGKELLGDIADLMATVKGLRDDKLNSSGGTISGDLTIRKALLVSGVLGVGNSTPEYTVDITGSVRLGGFSEADADEWPRVVWCRKADGTEWDEGLIKHSSQKGFFGRSGIGIHINESRDWSIWSSGWNSLLGVEGGTGNTKIKGRLEIDNSDLYFTNGSHSHSRYGNATGYAAIENAANYGALMILGRNIATPDAPNRIVKLWDYLQVNGNLDVAGSIVGKMSIATALGPDDHTDGGPIPSRTMTFTKRHANSAIRIIYCDNFRVEGNNVAARWEIRIDGAPPPGGAIYQDKYGSSGNFHEPATILGYAQGIGAGTHTIAVWVATPPGYPTCDAHTGWGSSRWTIEAQEVWI
jgi:cytoskeletal protein CcmA (bactofilin family)